MFPILFFKSFFFSFFQYAAAGVFSVYFCDLRSSNSHHCGNALLLRRKRRMRLRKENGGKRESSTPVKDKEKFRNAALSPSPPLLSSFPCRAAGEKLKNRKGEKNVCLGEEASEKRCVGKGKKREEKIPGRKNSGGGMELSEKRTGKVSSAGKFCSEAEEYVTLCSRSIPPFFKRGVEWDGRKKKLPRFFLPSCGRLGGRVPFRRNAF